MVWMEYDSSYVPVVLNGSTNTQHIFAGAMSLSSKVPEAPGGSLPEAEDALQNQDLGVKEHLETDPKVEEPKELEDEKIHKSEDQQIKVESSAAPADSTDQQTTKIQPTAATAPKKQKSPEPAKPPKNKSKDKASTKAEDKAASQADVVHEVPAPTVSDRNLNASCTTSARVIQALVFRPGCSFMGASRNT